MTPNMERGARIIIHEWVKVRAWDKVLIVTSKEYLAEAKAMEKEASGKARSVNTLLVENKGRHVGIFFDDNEAVFDPYTAIIAATEYSLVTTKAAKRCVSRNLHGTAEVPDLVKIFGNEFQIGWITLLPAVVILVLSVMQAGVKISMIASILTAIPICIWFQGIPVKNLSMLILTGFHSADSAVASMLDGGGISSMVKVGAIVCISSSYSGIFQETGILDGIQKMVIALADKTKPYLAVFVTAVLTGVVACNQTLSIILTDQLCSRTEADKEKFANYLEDSAVVIAPLIPWSIAGAVPLAAVGAPESSVLFALFLYLLPLWDLLIKK